MRNAFICKPQYRFYFVLEIVAPLEIVKTFVVEPVLTFVCVYY